MKTLQARGLRPNDRTFSTVITACRLAGRRELAFKVYKKAKREGVTNSLMVRAWKYHPSCVSPSLGCKG